MVRLSLIVSLVCFGSAGCVSQSPLRTGKLHSPLSAPLMETAPSPLAMDKVLLAHERYLHFRRGDSKVDQGARVSLLSPAYLTARNLYYLDEPKQLERELLESEVTRQNDAAYVNGTCFAIESLEPQSPFQKSGNWDGFVYDSQGNFAWLERIETLATLACTQTKLDQLADLTMVIRLHSGSQLGQRYFKLDWPGQTQREPVAAADAAKLYKIYSQRYPFVAGLSRLDGVGGERAVALKGALHFGDPSAFRRSLPQSPMNFLKALEFSLLYAGFGRGLGAECSANPMFKALEEYPILKGYLGMTLANDREYFLEEFVTCPELAALLFDYSPRHRDEIPVLFAEQLEQVSAESMSTRAFLQSTLNFYQKVLDHYFMGCEAGKKTACEQFKQYRQDAAAYKPRIVRIGQGEALRKHLDALLRKRKVERASKTEYI